MHYVAHNLSLAVLDAVNSMEMQSCIDDIAEILAFFFASCQRLDLLNFIYQTEKKNSKQKNALEKMCMTQ